MTEERKDDDRRFQQYLTRESSTLVLSTIASSLSLSLLVGLLTITCNIEETVCLGIFWSGLLFAVCGFLYRELTIHIKDYEDLKKLCILAKAREEWSKKRLRKRFALAFRMALVRFFFLIPIVAYGIYGLPNSPILFWFFLMGIIAFVFTLCEIVRLYDP